MNPVYLRVILYLLSTVLGMIPAAWAGFISYDAATQVLSVSVPGLVTAVGAGLTLGGGVFAIWGKK
jgi:hypothetical protein